MKTNRFAISVVALNLLLFLCLAAQPKPANSEDIPKVLRARAFEIVDDAGKVRASITVETNGAAVFRMRDSQGAIRVKLDAKEEGSGFLLLDDSTNPGLHLLTGTNGTTLTIIGKNGKKRVIEP
jgi:hypothetical protein